MILLYHINRVETEMTSVINEYRRFLYSLVLLNGCVCLSEED